MIHCNLTRIQLFYHIEDSVTWSNLLHRPYETEAQPGVFFLLGVEMS